jgi:hypothetical protein
MTSPETTDKVLHTIAEGFRVSLRSPVLHTPAEHGLDYESVSFPSADGVPLEGWFIPAAGSDKIIIANHPAGSAAPESPHTSNPGSPSAARPATTSK